MSAQRPLIRSGTTRRSHAPKVLAALALGGLLVMAVLLLLRPTSVPTPGSSPPARPSPAEASDYAAVFDGDATGASDVTDALTRFLESHDGQRVALERDGVYRVSSFVFSASDLTLDFRGAKLVGTKPGTAVLRMKTATNVVLNDPSVEGTGYAWDPELQWEHGIYVDGGDGITINRATTRDTHGDGIYVGTFNSGTAPATGVVIRDPDIRRAARNGIAPVAGEVTIIGGYIDQVGLHGIDFEVNSDVGAESINGIVDGIEIRRYGDLPIVSSNYAVAALGYSDAPKPSLVVRNLTGDRLRMTIGNVVRLEITGNQSETDTTAEIMDSTEVIFSDNEGISRI